jgi:TolB protein
MKAASDAPARGATAGGTGNQAAILTPEAIAAVESPREFRLHPRDRTVAYVAESGGARQLFSLSLRGGTPVRLTASEKNISDPQWSPDGRRLAYVRDDEIWVMEADGSRLTRLIGGPGGGPMAAGWPSCRVAAAGRRSG